MEFLWIFCKLTAILTLTIFLITLLYAIVSTLVGNIAKDIVNIKKYYELKEKYEDLLARARVIEAQLDEMKEDYSVDNEDNK